MTVIQGNPQDMVLKRKIFVAFRWAATGKFLGQLISWALTIIVARLLTPGDYGLMAMAMIFISFLFFLSELGLGAAVIQQENELQENELRKILGLVLIVNFCIFVGLFFTSPLIAGFFAESRLELIIKVLSIQFILSSFIVIPQSLLQRKLDLKRKSLVDLCVVIVGSITSLGLAWSGWGVWALIWGNLASMTLKVAALNIVLPKVFIPSFSLIGMKKIMFFGGFVTGTRVLWFIYTQADTFVAAKILGKEDVGAYSVAMDLATLPTKFNNLINEIVFPAFASVQNDLEKVGTFLLKGVRILSFFAFPMSWGMSSVAPEIIEVFLGEKWNSAVIPLGLLALVVPLRMIGNVLNTTLMGLGRPDISVIPLAISLVIMPTAFVVGSQFGLKGLCLAWITTYPFMFYILIWLALPIAGLKIRDLLVAVMMPALASFLMVMAVYAFKMLSAEDIHAIFRLAASVLIGGLTYLSFMWLANQKGFREIIDFVKDMRI